MKPDIDWDSQNKVEQFYIYNINDFEIRLRLIDNQFCYLTQKRGSGLTRDEIEKKIPIEIFNILKKLKKRIVLKKIRFIKNDWEIDFYYDHNLIITEKEAINVTLPDWLKDIVIKNITYDNRYKNKNIALLGFP